MTFSLSQHCKNDVSQTCKIGIGFVQNGTSRPEEGEEMVDEPLSSIICRDDGRGCSGGVSLQLTWLTQRHVHPHIVANLTLQPVQVMSHSRTIPRNQLTWLIPSHVHPHIVANLTLQPVSVI